MIAGRLTRPVGFVLGGGGSLGADTFFADLALPFGAVTTDLATAAPHVITTGPLNTFDRFRRPATRAHRR